MLENRGINGIGNRTFGLNDINYPVKVINCEYVSQLN